MNVLHTVLCVDWLKNINCAILRKIHWIVATLFLLCRDIISFCHDKEGFSLLEIVGNYVATYFLCHDITVLELNELCHDIFIQCLDINAKNSRSIVCQNNYFYVTT